MFFRTDLAIERQQNVNGEIEGIECRTRKVKDSTITNITIKSNGAAEKLCKPKGEYITVEVPALTDNFFYNDEKIRMISEEINKLLPKKGLVLVVGIGNTKITPDALGPQTAEYILATRHITEEFRRSTDLEGLRSVAVMAPGVLSQTGIETTEIINSISKKLDPSCVIVIDALASSETKRLGCTIQIANTGISPGSGVGNARPLIDKTSLGVPVISIGVPTVVDATTLAKDLISDSISEEDITDKISPRGEPMMVTPREIDLLIERASRLLGMSINCALHPGFSNEDLFTLVG